MHANLHHMRISIVWPACKFHTFNDVSISILLSLEKVVSCCCLSSELNIFSLNSKVGHMEVAASVISLRHLNTAWMSYVFQETSYKFSNCDCICCRKSINKLCCCCLFRERYLSVSRCFPKFFYTALILMLYFITNWVVSIIFVRAMQRWLWLTDKSSQIFSSASSSGQ